MIIVLPFRGPQFIAMACFAVVLAVGCSQKAPQARQAPVPPSTDAVALASPTTQAAADASSLAVDQAIAEADAAFNNGAYVKAVQVLQAQQQQSLPPEQAAKVQAQMAKLSQGFGAMMKNHNVNAEARAAINLMRRGIHPTPPATGGNQGP